MAVEVDLTVLDIETLLEPIPGENPVGEYLRYDGVYDQIEEFRNADDPNLPQGVWESDLKTADWNSVFELTRDSLASRTKDLQISLHLIKIILSWLCH